MKTKLLARLLSLCFVIFLFTPFNSKATSVAVTLKAPEGVSYHWFRSGIPIPDAQLQQLSVSQDGEYTVTVTELNGNQKTAAYRVVAGVVSKVTVYVIGDSTASLYGTTEYPRTGWAQVLQPFFNKDSVTVNDQAASGRSSKSFYDEGRWTTVKNLLKAGDFVFIQFAHNDEKTDDAIRYTNPATTFKYYLGIYVNETKARGAYPVLISSIPRNNWSASGVQQAHKPYTLAMKRVADSLGVPFIDMEASVMAYLNTKGKTFATDSLYNNLKAGVWPNYLTGNSDGTHLQEKGAFHFCATVVGDFKKYTGDLNLERLSKNLGVAFRVSAMPNPDLKGTITGTGVFPLNSAVTLKATPATGYRFVKWTVQNDTTAISRSATLSLNDSKSLSLIASFESTTAIEPVSLPTRHAFTPNPANTVVNINPEISAFQTTVADLNGKIVHSSAEEHSIDVRGLPSGVYIIRISTKTDQFMEKLVIAH